MITVLGKLADTQRYIGLDGYNVLPFMPDWAPDKNWKWLDAAIARGDQFLIVSPEWSGQFAKELKYLMKRKFEGG